MHLEDKYRSAIGIMYPTHRSLQHESIVGTTMCQLCGLFFIQRISSVEELREVKDRRGVVVYAELVRRMAGKNKLCQVCRARESAIIPQDQEIAKIIADEKGRAHRVGVDHEKIVRVKGGRRKETVEAISKLETELKKRGRMSIKEMAQFCGLSYVGMVYMSRKMPLKKASERDFKKHLPCLFEWDDSPTVISV